MAKNVTLTLTQAQAQALMALLGQADAAPTKSVKVSKATTTKSLTKADLTRKDGTVGKDGKVWWVSHDGTKRGWKTQEQYDYICNKRAYASGEKVPKERSDKEKADFKKAYAKKWAKWRAQGKHTSEENKAMHKQIVAELSK